MKKAKSNIDSEHLTGQAKNEWAVNLGRLGGLKRAENLTKEQRYLIAQKGGLKRWGHRPNVKMTGPDSEPASQ